MRKLIIVCLSIVSAACVRAEVKKDIPPRPYTDTDRSEFVLIPQNHAYSGPSGVVYLPSEQFVLCKRTDSCPVPQNRLTKRFPFRLTPPVTEEPIASKEPGRTLTETLFGTVQFAEEEATVNSAAEAVLDRLLERVKGVDPARLRVVVAGYTDDVGSIAFNTALAEERAASVADYLIGKGIPENNIKAAGRSRCCYVDSTKTPEGRARNRRAEIFIEPSEEAHVEATH